MVPRRRRADLGRPHVPRRRGRLPQGAVRRGRGRPGRAARHPRSATGRAARWCGNATCFPVSMARGATWDPELEERVGDAIGRELRAVGANLTGAVCVNVLRHPAWGRAQETYGEDPHHVGELGAALTRGLQRHVMACVKHFACNSMENARFSRRHRGRRGRAARGVPPALPPHRRRGRRVGDVGLQQRQRRVVRAEPRAAHRRPARRVGLRGLRHQRLDLRAARRGDVGDGRPRHRDAVPHGPRRSTCPARSRRGEASWDDVDRCGRAHRRHAAALRRRALRARRRPPTVLGSPEHRALAREVAARSVVLLRNEPVDGAPVLPLAAERRRGGGARPPRRHGQPRRRRVERRVGPRLPHGARRPARRGRRRRPRRRQPTSSAPPRSRPAPTSRSWSSATRTSTRASTSARPTRRCPQLFPSGRRARGRRAVRGIDRRPPADHEAAAHVERPRAGLRHRRRPRRRCGCLTADVELIRAVAAANPRTVVVDPGRQRGRRHASGSTRCPRSCRPGTAAARPGPGLADVLLGAVNPSAGCRSASRSTRPTSRRSTATPTPFTYDRWHGWWHLARNGTTPAFPFGFGLSYTTFELARRRGVGGRRRASTVRGAVRNTGDRDGADVVQVYAELPDPDARRRLVGFARVEVGAGGETASSRSRARRSARDP